jgi:hypothetical protein
MAIPTTTPLAGLPGDTPNDGADLMLLRNLSLSYLDELSFMPSFPEPSFPELLPSLGTDPGLSSVYPSWQEGSLGVCV